MMNRACRGGEAKPLYTSHLISSYSFWCGTQPRGYEAAHSHELACCGLPPCLSWE